MSSEDIHPTCDNINISCGRLRMNGTQFRRGKYYQRVFALVWHTLFVIYLYVFRYLISVKSLPEHTNKKASANPEFGCFKGTVESFCR